MSKSWKEPQFWMHVFFLVSGFSAILYQLIWQRVLFRIFGTNVQSVTVVVTAFMLGLGFGSMLGGEISKNPQRPLILLFGIFEIGIGIFGAFSLGIFGLVDTWAPHLTLLQSGMIAFLLLLFPTLMMGATLPILVGYFAPRFQNVGRAVGTFYFINTFGSGIGCIAAALFLFRVLGQQDSLYLAAGLNGVIGTAILVMNRSKVWN